MLLLFDRLIVCCCCQLSTCHTCHFDSAEYPELWQRIKDTFNELPPLKDDAHPVGHKTGRLYLDKLERLLKHARRVLSRDPTAKEWARLTKVVNTAGPVRVNLLQRLDSHPAKLEAALESLAGRLAAAHATLPAVSEEYHRLLLARRIAAAEAALEGALDVCNLRELLAAQTETYRAQGADAGLTGSTFEEWATATGLHTCAQALGLMPASGKLTPLDVGKIDQRAGGLEAGAGAGAGAGASSPPSAAPTSRPTHVVVALRSIVLCNIDAIKTKRKPGATKVHRFGEVDVLLVRVSLEHLGDEAFMRSVEGIDADPTAVAKLAQVLGVVECKHDFDDVGSAVAQWDPKLLSLSTLGSPAHARVLLPVAFKTVLMEVYLPPESFEAFRVPRYAADVAALPRHLQPVGATLTAPHLQRLFIFTRRKPRTRLRGLDSSVHRSLSDALGRFAPDELDTALWLALFERARAHAAAQHLPRVLDTYVALGHTEHVLVLPGDTEMHIDGDGKRPGPAAVLTYGRTLFVQGVSDPSLLWRAVRQAIPPGPQP